MFFSRFLTKRLLCSFPMTRSVRRSIGQSVCHNFLKGREVTLPCSYKSTRLKMITHDKLYHILVFIILFITTIYFYVLCGKKESCVMRKKGINTEEYINQNKSSPIKFSRAKRSYRYILKRKSKTKSIICI